MASQHDLSSLLDRNLCLPFSVTVLEDRRFAFIFPRRGGDLSGLIDIRMHRGGENYNERPFLPLLYLLTLARHCQGPGNAALSGVDYSEKLESREYCSLRTRSSFYIADLEGLIF